MAEYKIQGGFASNDDFVAFLNDKNIANTTQKIVLVNEMGEEISDEAADGTGESGDPHKMISGANYYMTIELSRSELESMLQEVEDYVGDTLHLY